MDGTRVGLACADGLFLDRRRIAAGDCANFESAHRLLMNRTVEAAVIENGPRTMVAEGLAYDRCQVGVVTRLDPSVTMPDHYIDDPDQMYRVLRTQIDVVLARGVGVLNASDAEVAEMASLCDGEVIFYSTDPDEPRVASHRADGGRAVLARDANVVLATGGEELVLLEIARVPPMRRAGSSCDLECLLAAVAAAWAVGMSSDLIRTGVETFDAVDPSATAGT
jgi:cyanophycin synthetase